LKYLEKLDFQAKKYTHDCGSCGNSLQISLLAGNLDAEPGSILTASATTRSCASRDFVNRGEMPANGIEILLQPLVGGDAGVDRATHVLLRRCRFHNAGPLGRWSRKPKNFGPFQRVPVITRAGNHLAEQLAGLAVEFL
jgi:hypothetical protein